MSSNLRFYRKKNFMMCNSRRIDYFTVTVRKCRDGVILYAKRKKETKFLNGIKFFLKKITPYVEKPK